MQGFVSGPSLTDADAETLRGGTRRSPVFDLVRRSQEMSPEVHLKSEPKAA
jgi:hypothetical protein